MSEQRLVDANALKETIVGLHHRGKEYSEADEAINNIIEAICDDIDNAPTVEPICPYLSDDEVKQPCLQAPCDRPKGEWVEGELKGCIACNICGCEFRYTFLVNCEPDFPNFCPECGADMRGDVNA